MPAFPTFAFTHPWILLALLALPAIWWLLRATPPAPKRILFPPLLILKRLFSRQRTPARTPWWLLLLRLAIAGLLILAMADPVLDPRPQLGGSGPLLIVLDDGWAAAPGWPARRTTLQGLVRQADQQNRSVYLLRTAPGTDETSLNRLDPSSLLRQLADLEPRPWPVDRRAARQALEEIDESGLSVFWLSDGVYGTREEEGAARRLAERLRQLGSLVVFADPPEQRARLLREPVARSDALALELLRPQGGTAESRAVLARGPGGEILARTRISFAADGTVARGQLRLPVELRNRIARIELERPRSAAEVVLFDERWRRRLVGLTGGHRDPEAQPLLSELYFVSRALAPYAKLEEGSIESLIRKPISMIVLADVGRLEEGPQRDLQSWIEQGGVLLRFAGPHLAEGGDGLLPVPLRQGDRILGGAMSWSKPLPFAPFPQDGPFAGLAPNPEALVYRQVLAQPGPELGRATLATLVDGTPIITGRKIGRGWLLLVHTTANTSWTSLPLSGLFIDLLRRTLVLAPGVGGKAEGLLRAGRVLDGFGRLRAPRADLLPLRAEELSKVKVGPHAPPGLWVPVEAGEHADVAATALNLQRSVRQVRPLDLGSMVPVLRSYDRNRETPLAPALLLIALLLTLADLLVAFGLRGLVRPGFTVLLLVFAGTLPLRAQEDERQLVERAAETRLAYVRTGIEKVDRLSEAGLRGLSLVLARRTSVEPADPVGVDVARDELALFPLLYWPVPPEHPELGSGALHRVDQYLKNGGMILFDTGDAARLIPGTEGGGPGERRLASLLEGLDLPRLIPVPQDHALTRSFYLLQDFPGRFTGQTVWVDEAPPGINDGVSSIVIGAHDWAGAWAVDEFGSPLLPVIPGGERQREMARRFGVNLVMYALTGNYKTDQVHLPALLERLGQ